MGRELPARGSAEQHAVVDGASSLLLSLFGDRAARARSSVGVEEAMFGIALELEMVAEAMEP